MENYIFPFEKLDVWQLSVELAETVLNLIDKIPQGKHLRIISQLEAGAISPAQNIAEGKGRQHHREFVQFLYIARGSIFEVVTLVEIFKRKGLLNQEDANDVRRRCEQIDRKLNGLINSLKGKPRSAVPKGVS